MIPPPAAKDLARDAEKDYALAESTMMVSALGEYTPEEMQQWIRRAVHAEHSLKRMASDWAETDTFIRNVAAPILGREAVDGDSYGVPPVENIVEMLVARAVAARKLLERARRMLCAELDLKKLAVVLIEDMTILLDSADAKGSDPSQDRSPA